MSSQEITLLSLGSMTNRNREEGEDAKLLSCQAFALCQAAAILFVMRLKVCNAA